MFKTSPLTIMFVIIQVLFAAPSYAEEMSKERAKWLKDKFSAQHQQLSAVVAVADMFYGCNQVRKIDPSMPDVATLVTKTDKNALADKLRLCLKGELPNSDTAINFGLIGCFDEQLKNLPEKDRALKKQLVRQAIKSLSKSERQKSFTQCVTDQSIAYLK